MITEFSVYCCVDTWYSEKLANQNKQYIVEWKVVGGDISQNVLKLLISGNVLQ